MQTDVTSIEAERVRRIRKTWVLGGFGVGIVVALVATTVSFAIMGWRVFPITPIWTLMWLPMIGSSVALRFCRVTATVPFVFKPRFPRFSIGDLMLLVAYLALLMGVAISTADLGGKARLYWGKATNASGMVSIFSDMKEKASVDAKLRSANATTLRARNVPSGITREQQEFLRKLDVEGPPSLREERYTLIGDSEQNQADLSARNVSTFQSLIDYYKGIAVKYEQAERKPWIPVEDDLPPPGSGLPPAPIPAQANSLK